MRRISRLTLAVGIAAALGAAGPAMAGPSGRDGSSGAVVGKLLDRLLGAAFGRGQDTSDRIDPHGFTVGLGSSGSGDQDAGPCTDPNG